MFKTILLSKTLTKILNNGCKIKINARNLGKHHLIGRLSGFNGNGFSICYKSYSTHTATTEKLNLTKKISAKSNYTIRTCTCGELNSKHVGQKVVLCGWLEFQRLKKFVVLRDGYGQTQLLVDDKNEKIQSLLEKLPYETIIQIEGQVLARPKEMINKKQSTGEIEVAIDSLTVLNPAKDVLPFNVREFQKAKESLRMQYRYLDMRFPEMQRNMRVRSEVLMDMRYFLCRIAHFVDVETPTLFKATPGGAQEFIVPTRFPGLFYSLVQSPQQFKQMLMAGGIDRYFQIARCYRDEGSRPDRQPEFTQLDIEMSFTNSDGVQALIEDLLCYSWPKFLPQLPDRFPSMKFKDAMEIYGSDKPDTRFGFKIQNCTELFQKLLKSQGKNFRAYYLLMEEPNNIFTISIKDDLSKLSKQYPVKFVQMKLSTKANFIEKVEKLIGFDLASTLWDSLDLKEDSILFLSFGDKKQVLPFLGKIRIEFANHLESKGLKIRSDTMNMLWITDFPLFEEGENPTKLNSAHHPFTAPQECDIHLLEKDPLNVRAQAYDLVLNGNEIGGGSIRIHDPVQQEYILKLLDIDKDFMQHMLDMLGSGCPPHGGIALGLDRLMSIILDTPSIRDVIAFPKTFEGRDPVSGAPSPISDKDKKLYHIQTVN